MRRFIVAALAAFLLVPFASGARSEDAPPKLVTILTAPEPQTQLMAMVLTMQAVVQGAEAHVLLCGPGGDIALSDAPASATTGQPPRDVSPQGLMAKIIERGATVEVCAIYLPGKDLGPDALIEGVGVAKPDAMAAVLLEENVRLLSL